MSAAVCDAVDEDGLPNLRACAWFQRVGSCSFGCWEEPACETDYPSPEGWPALNLPPAHEQNLRARRLAVRTENWLGWLSFRYRELHPEVFGGNKWPNRHDVLAFINREAET